MANEMKGNLMLMTAALIWGSTFAAQSMAMSHIGPFTFQSIRFLIGGTVLLIVILFMRICRRKAGGLNTSIPNRGQERIELLRASLACGGVLAVASCVQQMGIVYTTVGKAGFITSMYILIVPIMGLFFRRKVGLRLWFCVAVAVVGLYFLCMTEDLVIGRGDILVGLCAIAFAGHIMVIDHFASRVDGIKLCCGQFWVAGIIAAVPMGLIDQPVLGSILDARWPILYAGVISCGIAYTLQVLGQKRTSPLLASLLMSLESVFSVLAGLVTLRQVPTPRESLGCLLMFAAIVIAQLPNRKRSITKPSDRETLAT